MSYVQKIKDSRDSSVYLVRGSDAGKHAWHYVLIDKLKLPLFLSAIKSGSVDVAQYGNVLYSGWGEHPPEYIKRAIKEQYE